MLWKLKLNLEQAGAELGQAQLPTGIWLSFNYSTIPDTTTNYPQNIHFLSICYLPTLCGQFQAASLLSRVGGGGGLWGW